MSRLFTHGLTGLALGLWLLAPADASATPVTFSDGTFPQSDWSHELLFFQDDSAGNLGSFALSQGDASGLGNPDPYQFGSQFWTPGVVLVSHVFLPETFDPAVSGEILQVGFGFDLRVVGAEPVLTGNAIAGRLLLRQGGNSFVADEAFVVDLAAGAWQSFAGSYVAGDFGLVVPTVDAETIDFAQHPDFGPGAAAIEFGFATGASTAQAEGRQIQWGVDNWSVTVQPVPEPSSGLLGGIGLAFAIGLRRARGSAAAHRAAAHHAAAQRALGRPLPATPRTG